MEINQFFRDGWTIDDNLTEVSFKASIKIRWGIKDENLYIPILES